MASPTPDPHVLQPGHAPTPFTADEIRRASPRGRTITLRADSEGRPPSLRIRRYIDVDENGATIEFSERSSDGEVLEAPERHRTTWLELQAHASFPQELVAIAEETIDIPLGSVDCLRYTVRDGSNVTTFWFAKAYPGMPAKVVTQVGRRVISTVTMIAKENLPS